MQNINKEKYNTEENRRKVEEYMSRILGEKLKCLSIKVRDKDEKRPQDDSKEDIHISDEKKKQIDEKLSTIFGQEAKCVSIKGKKEPTIIEEDLFSTIVTYGNGEKGLVNFRMLSKRDAN